MHVTLVQAHEGARSYNDSAGTSNGLSWRPPLSAHTNSSSTGVTAVAVAAVAVSARGTPIYISSSSGSGSAVYSGQLLEGTGDGMLLYTINMYYIL
jgi:hypothetical protein